MIHAITNAVNFYLRSFQGLPKNIWYITAITFVNRMGTMVWPFLPLYCKDILDLNTVETANIMACYGGGSILGAYLGGQAPPRWGVLKQLIVSLVLTAVNLITLFYLHTFFSFAVGCFTFAVFSDYIRPIMNAGITKLLDNKEQLTRSYSLIRLSINLGWSVGTAVGGFLIFYYDYSYVFYLDALTCIAAAVVVFLLLSESDFKESVAGSVDGSEKRKNSVADGRSKTRVVQAKEISPYKDLSFYFFVFGNFIMAFSFLQIISTFPLVYKEHYGATEDFIGLLMAVNGVLLFLFEMPVVFFFESRFSKDRLIDFGLILIGLSYFCVYIFSTPQYMLWSGWSVIILITFGELFAMPFTNALVSDRAGKTTIEKYMGMYQLSWAIAIFCAPYLGLLIYNTFGMEVLFLCFTFLPFLGVGSYMISKRLHIG